jgi:hypothetical protein
MRRLTPLSALLLFVVAPLATAACGLGADWRVVRRCRDSGLAFTPGPRVARDESAWLALEADLGPKCAGRGRLVRRVDWGREAVWAVAHTGSSCCGYDIGVDSVRRQGDTTVIFVVYGHPPPGCGKTDDITRPAIVIAAPATAGTRLVARDAERGCR